MKTTTVSKRFVTLLCCIAVCVALIATALGFNLASRAQAEDAQENGIELLEEEPTGDIQLIEEETQTVPEDTVGGEAYQAGETAVTEETQTPAEEPASGEPEETPIPEDYTEPESPAEPDDSTEPEDPAEPADSTEPDSPAEPEDSTEPEGIPEESGEPGEAEPAGSEESAEPDLTGTEETGETVDAAEAEPEDIDAADEEGDADTEDADAEDTETEDADAEEEAISDEDDYGIMLLAENGTCGENLEWVLDDDGVLTISGTGAMYDWGSASATPWYKNRSSIKSVVIEDGVTSIGNNAFRSCTNLQSIDFQTTSMTSIGDSAFYSCSALASITIPNDVTSIGERAFYGCTNLASVDLPSTLISISDEAFYNCSALASITIPNGVTSIGSKTFYGCKGLTSVDLPSSLTIIGDSAFYNCSALIGITIPTNITSIGSKTFYGCTSLASVDLPSSLTIIGDSAFYNCSSLSSITIPEGVTTIGDSAFNRCASLQSIELPTSSLTSIGDNAFYNCSSLTSITIPEGVANIGSKTFYSCTNLASVKLPSTLITIGDNAFFDCFALTSIVIPESVTSIGERAFFECTKLSELSLPEGLQTIGSQAFQSCPLNGESMIDTTTVSAGADVYSIDSESTTQTTKTTSYTGHTLTIPESVTSVGSYAFSNSSVDYFVIGSNLTSITGNAFASKSLEAIIFDNYQDQVTVENDNYASIAANTDSDVSLIYLGTENGFELSLTKEVRAHSDFDTFKFEIMLTQQDGTPFSGELDADGTEDVVSFTDGKAAVEIASGDTLTLLWVPENMEWSIVEVTPADETVISVNGKVSDAEGTLTEDTAVTFANYYNIGITVSIVWDDADNQDGLRPDSVLVQLLVDEDPYSDPVELNADNGWSTAWSDLTIYADGHEIEYVVEVDVPDDYEADGEWTDNGDGTYSLVVTNTHTRVRDLTIQANVAGNSDTSAYDFEITLTQDGVGFEGELTLSNGETITFSDGKATLSVAAGEAVTVLSIPYGLDCSVTELTTGADSVLVTDGNGNVIAYAEGTEAQATADLGAIQDNTEVTFTNSYREYFPVDEEIVTDEEDPDSWVKNESVNEYNAIEIEMSTYLPAVLGYDIASGSFTLNFHDQLDSQLVLDEADADFSVAIAGYRIDPAYYTVTLGPDDGCTFHVDVDLTALYNDGVITDDDLEGATPISVFFFADLEGTGLNGTYASTVWYDLADGDAILSTSEADTVYVYTYEIEILKVDAETGEALSGATLGVYYDSELTNPVSRNAAPFTAVSGEDGYAVFYGLAEGTYYIAEIAAPEGYLLSAEVLEVALNANTVDTNNIYSATFVNTPIPEVETPAPTMSVDVGNGTEVNPGESITYTIGYTNGDEDGATIIITDVLDEGLDFVSATDGGTYDEATRTITWIITDVAANTEGSVSFTVVVNENALTAGQVSNSATVQINDEPAVTTNTVTNPVKVATTVTFEVVKVWDDNNDLYGERPELIVVVLLQNGQATTLTQLLSAENSWTGTFSDLPEYDENGEKIVYSIAEVTVPNYTSVITGDQDSGFTVTNTYDFAEITNPEPGTPDGGNPNTGTPNSGNPDNGVPQTGQDSLPIAPLAVSGAAIVAAGVALLAVRRRRAA